MTASKVVTQREVGQAGEKALKSAKAARKKIAAVTARAATLEEQLRAATDENNLLEKRLQLFHTQQGASAASADGAASASNDGDSNSGSSSSSSHADIAQLERTRKALIAEVALLSEEVSKVRAQSVAAKSHAAQSAATATRAEQKGTAALDVLQQTKHLAEKEQAAAAVREEKAR